DLHCEPASVLGDDMYVAATKKPSGARSSRDCRGRPQEVATHVCAPRPGGSVSCRPWGSTRPAAPLLEPRSVDSLSLGDDGSGALVRGFGGRPHGSCGPSGIAVVTRFRDPIELLTWCSGPRT